MATNGAPDNWDDGMDVSSKMEALNVNAPSFVPNVNAPAFVPGNWGSPAATSPETETAPDDKMQVDPGNGAAPEPATVSGNGPGRPAPADSWEDKADMSSTATTPEDEDMSMEDDTGEAIMEKWASLCCESDFLNNLSGVCVCETTRVLFLSQLF